MFSISKEAFLINKEKMDQIILRYLDGPISKEDRSQLYSWLKQSEGNREYFSQMEAIWRSSKAGFANPEQTEKALLRLEKRINNHENQIKHRKSNKTFTRFIQTATVAAVLLLGLLIGYNLPSIKSNAKNQITKVIMPKGSRGEVILSDGSSVWLNSESMLSYSDNFDVEKREVILTGEGFFSVAENVNKPFIVKTAGIEIKVLGTKFDVMNYENKKTIETTLISGKVSVKLNSDSEEIVLKPNEKLSFHKTNNQVNIEKVNALFHTNWLNNKLIFDSDKLEDIFSSLERWYNVEIYCDEKILLDTRASFTLRDESLEEIFRAMKHIVPLQYLITDTSVIVRSVKK